MKLLAIDPGTVQSGYVVWDNVAHRVLSSGIEQNERLLESLTTAMVDSLAIEMIKGMGMAVGQEVFETCTWIGKFEDRWDRNHAREGRVRISRHDVKMYLCGSARATDSNIRVALIDKFEPTGGGSVPQVGTKKQPGPLFGISSHRWSALAVAVTALKL